MAFLAPILPILAAAGPIISLIGSVAATGAALAANAAATDAAVKLADYRTQVAKNNAATEEGNALHALDKGQSDQYAEDLKNRSIEGDQLVAQGASGIRISSGSFVRSRATTAALARIDSMNIRAASEIDAKNYRIQEQDYLDEAKFLQENKKNAVIQGQFQGIGIAAGALSNFNYSSFITPASAPIGGLNVIGGVA